MDSIEKHSIEKAEEALERLGEKFEKEIFPKILFVHDMMKPFKELLKGIYIEGATEGMIELVRGFDEIDEEIYNKITHH